MGLTARGSKGHGSEFVGGDEGMKGELEMGTGLVTAQATRRHIHRQSMSQLVKNDKVPIEKEGTWHRRLDSSNSNSSLNSPKDRRPIANALSKERSIMKKRQLNSTKTSTQFPFSLILLKCISNKTDIILEAGKGKGKGDRCCMYFRKNRRVKFLFTM